MLIKAMHYLQQQREASLLEIAQHCGCSTDVMEGMLQGLKQRGQILCSSACAPQACQGCQGCVVASSTASVRYVWCAED